MHSPNDSPTCTSTPKISCYVSSSYCCVKKQSPQYIPLSFFFDDFKVFHLPRHLLTQIACAKGGVQVSRSLVHEWGKLKSSINKNIMLCPLNLPDLPLKTAGLTSWSSKSASENNWNSASLCIKEESWEWEEKLITWHSSKSKCHCVGQLFFF